MTYDYAEIQRLASLRMSLREICDRLDYDFEQYMSDFQIDPQLKRAWKIGRATSIENAAQTVRDAVDGSIIKEKGDYRLRAALEFLERHSPDWRKAK